MSEEIKKSIEEMEENKKDKKSTKIKELTLKDIWENPVYLEMMECAEDFAGHLTEGWRKFTI